MVYITAHPSKIHGVDWSRSSGTTLVTCSNDATVKVCLKDGNFSLERTDLSMMPNLFFHSNKLLLLRPLESASYKQPSLLGDNYFWQFQRKKNQVLPKLPSCFIIQI